MQDADKGMVERLAVIREVNRRGVEAMLRQAAAEPLPKNFQEILDRQRERPSLRPNRKP